MRKAKWHARLRLRLFRVGWPAAFVHNVTFWCMVRGIVRGGPGRGCTAVPTFVWYSERGTSGIEGSQRQHGPALGAARTRQLSRSGHEKQEKSIA